MRKEADAWVDEPAAPNYPSAGPRDKAKIPAAPPDDTRGPTFKGSDTRSEAPHGGSASRIHARHRQWARARNAANQYLPGRRERHRVD